LVKRVVGSWAEQRAESAKIRQLKWLKFGMRSEIFMVHSLVMDKMGVGVQAYKVPCISIERKQQGVYFQGQYFQLQNS
jgi:hypothetical protein